MNARGRVSLILLLLASVLLFGNRIWLSRIGLAGYVDWLRPVCGAAMLICGISLAVDLVFLVIKLVHGKFRWESRLRDRLHRESRRNAARFSHRSFNSNRPIIETDAEVTRHNIRSK